MLVVADVIDVFDATVSVVVVNFVSDGADGADVSVDDAVTVSFDGDIDFFAVAAILLLLL